MLVPGLFEQLLGRHYRALGGHQELEDGQLLGGEREPPAGTPAAAIGAVLGLLYLFPILAAVVTDRAWQRHLEQIGPRTAGLAIQATTGLRGLPLSPWAGLGVLAAWATAALLAGGLLLRLRDA